jgi:hypothetical protein
MIDLNNVPVHSLDLKDLLHAKEIRQYMRIQDIREHCYAFVYKNKVMKYGIQYEWKPTTYGERSYRQAWYIPGWPTKPKSSSGDDMLDIIKNFPNINKNDVTLVIFDMTHYPRASSVEPEYEVKQLERQLIKDHIDSNNEPPVGNIKTEDHMDQKSIVKDAIFDSLFHG